MTYTFAANDNGRNASAALNGTTAGAYLYNAFGQRVQKTVGSTVTQFVHDRAGHLLLEADGSGVAQREYIWLDDVPVALVDDTGAAPVLYYIHSDQLGAPQKITNASAVVVWDGVFDPFGNARSYTAGVWDSSVWDAALWGGSLSLTNLRFPGQYADAETALNQNWFRDYDPTIGRYVQSDPIGLRAGPNTYGYVGGSPLSRRDTRGLSITHNYKISAVVLCSASDAFDIMKMPLMTGPGAPAAQEGCRNVVLWLKNPITQDVDSSTMTITNSTLPGHTFQGQVVIQVTPNSAETSTITITGTGSGGSELRNDANDVIGYGYFGSAVALASQICAAAAAAGMMNQ